ncbi:MAG: ABC transporter permease [Gemmatimonadota bacterium]|jgi:putative ABC transport system permease protein
MSVLLAEAKHAFRALMKRPLFTGVAVLTLAVGIGANTAIFSVVRGVLLRPLPFERSDRLVRICETNPQVGSYCVASPPNVMDWRAASRTLSEIGLGRDWPFHLRADGKQATIAGGLATAGFFRALRVKPALGRLIEPEDVVPGRHVVVLDHRLWADRFGSDPGIVGRRVELDGEPYTVVGVLPAGFEVPGLEYVRLWRPLHFDPRAEENRIWRGFQVIGRMADGVSLTQTRSELETIRARLAAEHPATNKGWGIRVESLRDSMVASVRPALLVFTGAVALVLLIVCANLANLLLARSVSRRQEMAVRAALGGSRRRLAVQVLTEGALLSLLGGVGGVLLAVWGVDGLLALVPGGMPRAENVAVDGSVLVFALGLSLLTTFLFATLPALRGARVELAQALKTGQRSVSADGGRLRAGLVVVEIALALTLLVDAGLLARSFGALSGWDPGFDRQNLVTFSLYLPHEKYTSHAQVVDFWRRARQQLGTVPGVTSVGAVSAGPLFGGVETDEFVMEGHTSTPGSNPSVTYHDASPGYLETLGVQLLRGRMINDGDVDGGPHVAVVNEAMARLWPDDNPVGAHLRLLQNHWEGEIVGVVRDINPLVPGTAAKPQLYWPLQQKGRPFVYFVLRTSVDPGSVVPAVRARLAQLDPDLQPGTFRTLNDWVGTRLVRPRFNMLLVGLFSFIALLLATTGIYGVLAYIVARRSREIGLRMALGAGQRRVALEVLARGSRLTAFGIAGGLVLAFATSRFLASLLFGVRPTDPVTFFAVALLLAAVALLATYLPARRASRLDPMEVLRE